MVSKKKKVNKQNQVPTYQTVFNSNYLRLHTDGKTIDFDRNHTQQCYVDKNEQEYQDVVDELDISLHTFITVIESKGLRTNNSYYNVINCAWTMIAKHSAISREELLGFRTFRVSIGYNDGVSPVPRISYIMKRSFMKEKLLLEKNKNVIIAGNMDAILTAFSRAIAELEEDHLNILEENSIPMKAKKGKKQRNGEKRCMLIKWR